MSLIFSTALSFLGAAMQAHQQNKRYMQNAENAKKAQAFQSDGMQAGFEETNRQLRKSAFDTAMTQLSQKSQVVASIYERGISGQTIDAARATIDQQIGRSKRSFTRDLRNVRLQADYQGKALQSQTQGRIDSVQMGGSPLMAGLMAGARTFVGQSSSMWANSGSTLPYTRWLGTQF